MIPNTAQCLRCLGDFALEDLLTKELGWSPASASPLRITAGRSAVPLHPLAERDGRIALHHQTPIGESIHEYALRRAIRAEVMRTHLDPLIIFSDVLRTAQVWQWAEYVPGRMSIYREHSYRAGDPDPLLVRKLAGLGGATGDTADADPAPDAAVELRRRVAALVLPALLRRVRRRCPAAFRPGGEIERRLNETADFRHLARESIGECEDPKLLRAFWRSLKEMAVFDPACGAGERLMAALEVLEPLYDACIERMGSWIGDLDRSRTPHRPEKLADFRTVLRRAHDLRRYPDRRHFIVQSILRDNLYGVDPRPEMVNACGPRLLRKGAGRQRDGGAGPAARLTELDFNLRTGDAAYGFATRAEVERAVAGTGDAEARVRRIGEESEAAGRALRLLRRMRTTEDGDPANPAGGMAVRDRMDTLRTELDALWAKRQGVAPGGWRQWRETHRPFHLWIEFHGVVARGGFDTILREESIGGHTECVREANIPFGAPGPIDPPRPINPEELASMDSEANDCTQLQQGDAAYPAVVARLLGEQAPAVLAARGKIGILRRPPLAIFCSVRAPGDIILRTLDLSRELRDADIATIGGFQSPVEKECLTFLLRGDQPVVISPARGIERMRLPAAWRGPLEDGRLLLLSRFGPKRRRPTAPMAEARNRLVGALARAAFIAHATPSGRTYRLAKQLLDWGKPVFTLDDPHNADLLLLGARPVPKRVGEMLGSG